MQQLLVEKTRVGISRLRLWVWLQRLGLRHKKNRSAPRSRSSSLTFSHHASACLVFLDEGVVTTEMTRRLRLGTPT